MYTEYAQQIWLLKGINNIWKQIMYLFSLVRNAKANWLVTHVQGTYSDNNEWAGDERGERLFHIMNALIVWV